MAGDTLRGIGKKELAESIESPPQHSAEPIGAEPIGAEPIGAEPIGAEPIEAEPTSAVAVPDTTLEAEARPLRSLDDLPTDRTGRPAPTEAPVDDAVPLPATPSTPRSGSNRVSFGTMIGHEMHSVQVRVAATMVDVDASTRGTAHGHDVHLPANPGMNAEPESAPIPAPAPPPEPGLDPVRAPAPTIVAPVASERHTGRSRDDLNAFSGGDHTFFDTDPVNDEYEPENPRAPIYKRLAISGAVVAVVGVVVVAWVHSGSTGEESPPVTVKTIAAPAAAKPSTAPPAPVPAARPVASPTRPITARQEEPPTSTIPSSIPETIPPPPARVANTRPVAPRELRSPPAPAAAAAHEVKTSAAPRPVSRDVAHDDHDRKPVSIATPPRPPTPAAKAASPPAGRAPKPEAPRPVARSSAPAAPPKAQKSPAARGKQKYDPDGTLPLSFD